MSSWLQNSFFGFLFNVSFPVKSPAERRYLREGGREITALTPLNGSFTESNNMVIFDQSPIVNFARYIFYYPCSPPEAIGCIFIAKDAPSARCYDKANYKWMGFCWTSDVSDVV
ncbi:hypothetical protein HXA31_11635 [Salipaludibacillus agaradhaerens]|jgi:hypothetical protein|uniref:hypothetical protein n=1 Tax=Salipaludibacillus agaradhaerens TaxID=76935 RepID=UPI002151B8B8|nr:hypothetical protein [Salipaludibacillus agaradhaerens]MCR6115027.1 hypothetical protein [Salipaludibacillus agaradhaerens]